MIVEYNGKVPKIGKDVFIAPNATVIGDVVLHDGVSVWYGAVIRGDTGRIEIGRESNIQDNAVVHVNIYNDTVIGARVTVGHEAVLEGCRIADNVLVGMNATVLDGVKIGSWSIIAAGAVVREGSDFGEHSLIAGVPAKYKRDVDAQMAERISQGARSYAEKGQSFSKLAKTLK